MYCKLDSMWDLGDVSGSEEVTSLRNRNFTIDQQNGICSCTNCFTKENLKRRIPIVSWLPKYSLEDCKGDLIAGATVAITVIPQGLAQASLANLPAQYGLYTAFMGCFMYTIFGSCKDLTIGPTSILSLMTARHVEMGGITYCILITFLAGLIMLLMGILNLGVLLSFISSPVISGFTTAAALTIATTQLAGLFGLNFQSEDFIHDVKNFFEGLIDHKVKYCDMGMGLGSIAFLLLLRYFRNLKFHSCCPVNVARGFEFFLWTLSTAKNAILVIICAGIAAILLAHGNTSLTLTKQIKPGLPPFQFPVFSYDYYNNATNETVHKDFIHIVQDMGSGLAIIPLIAILEAVAIAKSFAHGKRIDGTQEMVALGICNIMGSFVSSYPATGSFSRTAINYSSGVRTPAGGIITGGLVLLALGVMSSYFRFIPKASLSAIIFVAVLNMVHYEDVFAMWKTKKLDLIPFTATVIASLFLGIEYGILIGVVISLCFLLRSDASPKVVIEERETFLNNLYLYVMPDRSILFPSAEDLQSKILHSAQTNHFQTTYVVLVDCRHIMDADYTTSMCFKNLIRDLQDYNTTVIFVDLQTSVQSVLKGAIPDKFLHFKSLEDAESFIDALYIDQRLSPVPSEIQDLKYMEGSIANSTDETISTDVNLP